MNTLFDVWPPGSRIRSFDFCPKTTGSESYLEGVVLSFNETPSPSYSVYCDYCNYIGRAGMVVNVPIIIDHHDFKGRLLFVAADSPHLSMEASVQYFSYLDAVWVLEKNHDGWVLFNQVSPDGQCWKIPTQKDGNLLWDACMSSIPS